MVREDLIEGAISFLQDPSVASAPIDQRIAFLRSKNLTQEEIDVSLARVGQSPVSQTSAPPQSQSSQQGYYRPPPSQQQYGYQQPPYWSQYSGGPPEPPRRDWRDWFIMATVLSGTGYALYWSARRWVAPLISPPTPPQLEQDKAAVDASFDKAFALLDQLATDTQELKDAEKQRTEKLDAALAAVESVVGRLKQANEDRDAESKRMAKELTEIKEQIPRALEREKEGTENKLKDLVGEVKSLRTLVANRVAAPQPARPVTPYGGAQTPLPVNGINGSQSGPDVNAIAANGASNAGKEVSNLLSERPASASSYGSRLLGGKAQIPSWQLEAKKRSEAAKKDAGTGSRSATPQDLSDSGTATPEVEAVEASAA